MKGTRLLLMLLLASSYGAAQSGATGAAEVEQLQVRREGADVKIEVILTGAVRPSVETATNPDRLVLSLPGIVSDAKQKRYPLNANGVRGVRLGLNSANPPVTRVVVDLDSAHPYTLSAEGNSIVLRVQATEEVHVARHDGPAPAASAPLVGVFRRKPPAPPVADISTQAPIPVPTQLPAIDFPQKQPVSAQPLATASATKPSAAHPKLGSLQQGTVFPGIGSPGSGAVPPPQTSATNPNATNPGAPVTGSGASGTPVSPVATAGSPVAAITVSVAPTAATKPGQPTTTAAGSLKATTTAAPTGQGAAGTSAPAVAASGRTAGKSAGSAVVAGATASAIVPPPSSTAAGSATSPSTPAAPTTSSAGAPNVTSKVLSAIVTPPPTTAPLPAAASTASQGPTVSNPLGLPPAATSTASQGATVSNPLGLPPAATSKASQGATVSNPLGLPPAAPSTASVADDKSQPATGVESTGTSASASVTATVPGAKTASPLGQGQLSGGIVTSSPKSGSAEKAAPGTSTIAKAIEPEIPSAFALRATHPDFRTAFRVKYVASGAAYLDGGRSAGLSEGMKLVVRETATSSTVAAADGNDDHIVAELEVTSVAETSAVTDVHTPKRDITPGDLAYLSAQDEQALVQQSTLSATRKYPTVISFTEGDTLDEEARTEIPRPPMPSVNRARGRLGFDYMGTSFHGATGGTSMNLGLMARMDMTRIGGTYWNLSGYWRGRLNANSYSGTATIQDLINRTYHLSMNYDNPDSHWVAGFGRMYLPWAVSLDTIDGGYVGRRLGRGATVGVFGGSTPDPTSWSYNPDRRSAGTFVNFEGGSFENFRYTSTSGIGLSTIKWKLDRPFIFFENGIYYKRYVAIYDTLQADSPAGNQAVTAPGPGIGRNFLTVRFQPVERIELDANYNYFRDLPTFDPSLIGTTLLDKYLFQGFSAGVRLEVLKQIWLYTNLGRSNRSGDPTSAMNSLYGITFGRIPWVRLRADAHYTRFNSSFGSGYYESVSVSRSLSDNFRLELLGGKQNFSSTFSSNSNTNFVTSNVEMNMGLHYFVQGGFTVSRGVSQNYDQWLFTLGYRFDTRQKGKSQ
ncbi:MAG TPA: AMIN domain-containing protein [Terriglobales bacterium]|nr:AMIN domain-containing protein [Terriglobales bacterium]